MMHTILTIAFAKRFDAMIDAQKVRLFLLLFVFSLIIACGGGGGDDPEPIPPAPDPDITLDRILEDGDRTFSNTGAYYDLYSFTASTSGIATITMSSTEVDAYLQVHDGTNVLVSDDNSAGGTDAKVQFYVTANQEYFVQAGCIREGGTGTYSITYPGDLTNFGEVYPDPTFTGTLAKGDYTFSDTGSYFDKYSFTASTSGTATITMSSTEVDAFLQVLDEDANVLENDDNSGGGTDGTDAQVVIEVTEGEIYYVRAGCLREGETGTYTITFSGDLTDIHEVKIDYQIDGTLTDGDFTYSDTKSYYDEYSFTATTSGTATITMSSNQVDAYLQVHDGTNILISNNDSGGDSNAQVEFEVTEGEQYFVQAGCLREGETGNYTLTFSGDLTDIEQVLVTQIEGTLENGDSTFSNTGAYYDVYSFTASTSGTATITMSSNQVDAYLQQILDDGENWDDNSGEGTDAQLEIDVTEGEEYLVVAGCIDEGDTGTYTITFSGDLTNIQAEN